MPAKPVIVTRSEVERIFRKENAESAIQEQAAEEGELQHAQAMAMTGAILRELQKAENAQGTDRVVVTAQHGPASRLQSLIASGEAGDLQLQPMPAGGLEAKFDTHDWLGWATVAWSKLKHPIKHPLLRPSSPTPQPLPTTGRIGLIGDWGTGLYGAPVIAQTVRDDKDPYAMLVHLGDTYYSGAQSEIKDRFLALWPQRAEATHRCLNSNHDMYSGGDYYFGDILPKFNQDASYFAHQNDNWLFIGLDVAHTDHAIEDADQLDWLEHTISQAGSRKVVFLSHQQLFSCFDEQGTKLWGNPRFSAILRSKQVFAWYWGHEHRCAIYQEKHPVAGLFGRCIGHGGMPQSRTVTQGLPKANAGNADWRQAPAKVDDGGQVIAPPSLVLEGPNPLIEGEEDKFTPHGYAVLTIDGPHLIEEVMDPNGKVIFHNQLA